MSTEERALVEFLATHDLRCPECGHHLRSAASPACPECGLALTLAVAPRREACRIWALILAAACLPAGEGIRRWILEGLEGFPTLRGALPANAWPWYPLHYALLLSPLLPLAVLLGRRWIQRRAVAVQWALFAVPLALFVAECLSLLR